MDAYVLYFQSLCIFPSWTSRVRVPSPCARWDCIRLQSSLASRASISRGLRQRAMLPCGDGGLLGRPCSGVVRLIGFLNCNWSPGSELHAQSRADRMQDNANYPASGLSHDCQGCLGDNSQTHRPLMLPNQRTHPFASISLDRRCERRTVPRGGLKSNRRWPSLCRPPGGARLGTVGSSHRGRRARSASL